MHPAYAAIRAAARALRLPTSFRTDLTQHDRTDIYRRPASAPFVWALYSNGTHLIFADGTGRSRFVDRGLRPSSSARPLIDCIASTFVGLHWFVWNGQTLVACPTAAAAADIFAELCAPLPFVVEVQR